jgi:hypothetical protein
MRSFRDLAVQLPKPTPGRVAGMVRLPRCPRASLAAVRVTGHRLRNLFHQLCFEWNELRSQASATAMAANKALGSAKAARRFF